MNIQSRKFFCQCPREVMFLRACSVSRSCAGHFHSPHLIEIKSHLVGGILRLRISDLPRAITYVSLLTPKFIASEHRKHFIYNSVSLFCLVCVSLIHITSYAIDKQGDNVGIVFVCIGFLQLINFKCSTANLITIKEKKPQQSLKM